MLSGETVMKLPSSARRSAPFSFSAASVLSTTEMMRLTPGASARAAPRYMSASSLADALTLEKIESNAAASPVVAPPEAAAMAAVFRGDARTRASCMFA
eukprot:7384292-Prymnesium_polylepis.1